MSTSGYLPHRPAVRVPHSGSMLPVCLSSIAFACNEQILLLSTLIYIFKNIYIRNKATDNADISNTGLDDTYHFN